MCDFAISKMTLSQKLETKGGIKTRRIQGHSYCGSRQSVTIQELYEMKAKSENEKFISTTTSDCHYLRVNNYLFKCIITQ
jgi:hypothetical protein